MINYGLENRVALITGANNPQGIGATTALAFAREGAKVVLVYKKIFRPFDANKTDKNGVDRYYAANAGNTDDVERKLMIGLTKALAKEVGPAGVRVNCVCPGVIQTPMNDRLTVEEAEELMTSIPLDRFGSPAEVAEALVFLASEKASYITGAVLDVNGGI